MAKKVRVTVDLGDEVVQAIEELGRHGGHSRTEAIRRAISLAKLINDHTREGGKVLLMDASGKMREVLLV